jgi:hypothetical protein
MIRLKRLGLLLIIAAPHQAMAGEVLQNISDDSVNVSIQAEPGDQSERRFSYRVICSPAEESLPDCMSTPAPAASYNSEADKPSMVLPVPDFPAETADIDSDQDEAASAPIAEPAKPRKKTSKQQHTKTVKKSAKKSVKKPAKNKK